MIKGILKILACLILAVLLSGASSCGQACDRLESAVDRAQAIVDAVVAVDPSGSRILEARAVLLSARILLSQLCPEGLVATDVAASRAERREIRALERTLMRLERTMAD